jgi:hypothetical protein
MKKIQLILIASTITFFSSCTKDGDFDLNLDNFFSGFDFKFIVNNHFDSVGLEYMRIPVGRTFQYRDSASNQLLSVKTIKSDTSAVRVSSPGSADLFADVYKLELRLLSNLSSGPVWFAGESFTETNRITTVLDYYDPEFELTNSTNKVSSFWYPLISSPGHDYNLLVNYDIEGKTYQEVHVFHSSNGAPITDPGYIESWYYWVKGIGIVERRIKSGTYIKTEFLKKYF